jgi:hypothetical protein
MRDVRFFPNRKTVAHFRGGRMLRKLGTILFLTGSISAFAADKIQSLNLKVGLWEVTHTTSLTGTPPIPPEMLAKMTPEQRAKFEERMKARAAAPPKTHTEKSCITQKDLDKDTLFSDDDDKSCTRSVISSTNTKLEMRVECQEDGTKRTGSFKLEAATPESVKGSMQMVASNDEQAMNINSTFTAKWVGAACGDVE